MILPSYLYSIEIFCFIYRVLESRACYVGLILAPTKGFKQKRERLTLFVLILGHFWCSVGTSIAFSSSFSNFEKKYIKIIKINKCQEKNVKIEKSKKIKFKSIQFQIKKIKKNPKKIH